VKQLSILILEESDGGHAIGDVSRRWNMGLTEHVQKSDLVIRIEKGQVEVVKNRHGGSEMNGLVEDIAFAYSEGHL
jgi:hypothetical protein